MPAPLSPEPPTDDGRWILLQHRHDRSFWQHERATAEGEVFTRFVIVRAPERLDYDTFDEAEGMFEAMED